MKKQKMIDDTNAIVVENVYKKFKLVYDKPYTLKERLVFWKNTKTNYHEVLKNINLEIKKGETVALIGVNGSGKSTLLKLMTKIIYPTTGTITTNGKLTSLLELGAGFHPDFTGRENIYFNASIFGLTRKQIDERLNTIIEFSELKDFLDVPVKNFSSGMVAKLAFSIATIVDPEILIVDEILSVGDIKFQEKSKNKMLELIKGGTTVLYVSHSIESIQELCTKVVWLDHGKIVEIGDPEKICNKYYKKQLGKDYKKK